LVVSIGKTLRVEISNSGWNFPFHVVFVNGEPIVCHNLRVVAVILGDAGKELLNSLFTLPHHLKSEILLIHDMVFVLEVADLDEFGELYKTFS
jgi:hypothetical protein